MSLSRRALVSSLAVTAAFGGLARRAGAQDAPTYLNEVPGYGPLKADPNGILDLPEGFSYSIVSYAGQEMDDGLVVPHRADGMGCFPLGGSKVALVRNHELRHSHVNYGPLGLGRRLPRERIKPAKAYDLDADGYPMPGGTTTMIYDLEKRRLVSQHLSLSGTMVNCAGGPTPWGSWLTCEEIALKAGNGGSKDHGWVFEVPAKAKGLVDPVPLKAMGRFQHEAAAVDPATGVIYLTEDSFDSLSLFYRFLPNERTNLRAGGRLQAMGFKDGGGDLRNWDSVVWTQGQSKEVVWIDLEDTDNPNDDLRLRGHAKGAVIVGRGEGVFFGPGEVFVACTNGGPAKHGQILRYRPSPIEGQPGESASVELFVEPSDPQVLDFADNITISPQGHLIVCEDRYSDTLRNHIKAITPQGKVYTIGRNVFRDNAEVAGACFSPDGSTMFVNIYWPGITLAITGPWGSLAA